VFPFGHDKHVDDEFAPAKDEYMPAKQFVHEVELVFAVYVPAGQLTQELEPAVAEAVPTGQNTHTVEEVAPVEAE